MTIQYTNDLTEAIKDNLNEYGMMDAQGNMVGNTHQMERIEVAFLTEAFGMGLSNTEAYKVWWACYRAAQVEIKQEVRNEAA